MRGWMSEVDDLDGVISRFDSRFDKKWVHSGRLTGVLCGFVLAAGVLGSVVEYYSRSAVSGYQQDGSVQLEAGVAVPGSQSYVQSR